MLVGDGGVGLEVDEVVWGLGGVEVFDEVGTEGGGMGEEDGEVVGGLGGSRDYGGGFVW